MCEDRGWRVNPSTQIVCWNVPESSTIDGVVTIVATVDGDSGELVAGPEVISRGFVYAQNSPELIEQVRERSLLILREFAGNSGQDVAGLSRQIRNSVSSYLQKQTGLRPMVLPVVLESE